MRRLFDLGVKMRVLVIGGTGFIGLHVTRELIRRDHRVTVFHRGRTAVPPGAREILGDRQRLTESADNLRALAPDVVIDVVLSSGRQARELMTVFRGQALNWDGVKLMPDDRLPAHLRAPGNSPPVSRRTSLTTPPKTRH